MLYWGDIGVILGSYIRECLGLLWRERIGGLGFRVEGLGSRVQGLGFRV